MNKVDILLVYPEYSYPKKSPPIGLGYIAAVLERRGYKVKILDMSTSGLNCGDLKREVEENRPAMTGISFMTNQFEEAVAVSKAIKEVDKNIPVITGGPHVSALPEEILGFDTVDIAVIGEGEISACELADYFIKKTIGNLSTIKGIAYKENGNIRINERQPLINDLDSLPFPAWHLLPVEKYSVPGTGGNAAENTFAVISSRGCPNNCIFCDSHTIFGRNFRARSAKSIFNELIYLNKNFGATQFDFVDDTITVNKNRMNELCNLLSENKCDFKWMCNARVNTVDEQLLKTMKETGCVRIEFGIESGDEQVLKNIKKHITIEQIKNAHKLARQAGLQVGSFVMVGNKGEDLQSVQKTKKLLEEIDTDDIYIAIATPFPGTELYKIAKSSGWLLITDWSRYVTSPTYLPGYQPIMKTDKMGPQEILKAFFYLHSQFVKGKLTTRYGKHFLLNKKFYRDNLFNVHSFKDVKHKFKMAKSLVATHFLH